MGIGATVWEGSAFECDGANYNFIALRHSEFNTSEKPQRVCNDGGIIARAIGVVNNHYTSQLMLTVSPEMNNRTVECVHDYNLTSTVVNSTIIGTVYIMELCYKVSHALYSLIILQI